jgi:hypothetical protein
VPSWRAPAPIRGSRISATIILVKALRGYKSAARVDPGGIMAASVKDPGDAEFVDLAYDLANLR